MPSPRPIHRIVSLPPGTCCSRAVDEFRHRFADALVPSAIVKTVPGFFEARLEIETTSHDGNTLFLVPDISEINALITEAAGWTWHPEISFPFENPPLWFVHGPAQKTLPQYAQRCASIPALRPLLAQDSSVSKPTDLVFLDKSSTQEAALAAADGECGWAITNQFGLDKYKLTPIQRLKHMLVYWKAFTYEAPTL